MKLLKTVIILSALTFFIAACGQDPPGSNGKTNGNSGQTAENKTPSQPSSTPDELASAAKIYKEKCSRCHQEDGTGGKVEIEGTTINAEDLTSDKMKKIDDEKFVKYIENGVPDEGMPAFKGKLTDQEIKDVIKYIRREFQK
ncbi:MAG: cytochrome c [Pyrinomonadaceae bacterium]